MPTFIKNPIVRVKANASIKWQALAMTVVKRLATKRPSFTSFDVLQVLEKCRTKTHDLRAIGAIMLDARKAGWIESAGLVRRQDKHSRGATTLWSSKLYRAPETDAA